MLIEIDSQPQTFYHFSNSPIIKQKNLRIDGILKDDQKIESGALEFSHDQGYNFKKYQNDFKLIFLQFSIVGNHFTLISIYFIFGEK